MAFGVPASVLGFLVSGDLAGQTIYTDRFFRKVHFPQAPPKSPPTAMQQRQRTRFTNAIANWGSIAIDERSRWEQITQKASMFMTGHNLFIHFSLNGKFANLQTLRRQTGISVDNPTFIPWEPE